MREGATGLLGGLERGVEARKLGWGLEIWDGVGPRILGWGGLG